MRTVKKPDQLEALVSLEWQGTYQLLTALLNFRHSQFKVTTSYEIRDENGGYFFSEGCRYSVSGKP